MSKPLTLTLERKDQDASSGELAGGLLVMTPAIDEDYWCYRVRLSEGQAILGFPKFGTVGIGFAAEEDWNTNLPYTAPAAEICEHIWRNVGGPLERDDVLRAIEMVQAAATEDRG